MHGTGLGIAFGARGGSRWACIWEMSVNEDSVFAYGRDPEYLCNSSLLEYRLYGAKKEVREGKAVGPSVTWKKLTGRPEGQLTKLDFSWKVERPPLLVRAMVLAGETLFVAGPPDVVDEKQMWGRSNERAFQEGMREQAEALAGRRGAILWAVSATDGTKLAERRLDFLPAFDGMIAAEGKLLVTTAGGEVVCFGD